MTLISLAARADTAAALKPGDVLRGHFVQERFLSGFAQPVRSEGSYVLAPGSGLVWRGTTPFPVTTVISPAGLMQSVNGTETTRLPAAKVPFLARLYDMLGGALAGNWQALESEFTVARDGGRILLTPRRTDATQPIRAIALTVGRFVDAVEITRPDGDRDRLTFSEQVLSTGPLAADEAALLGAAK